MRCRIGRIDTHHWKPQTKHQLLNGVSLISETEEFRQALFREHCFDTFGASLRQSLLRHFGVFIDRVAVLDSTKCAKSQRLLERVSFGGLLPQIWVSRAERGTADGSFRLGYRCDAMHIGSATTALLPGSGQRHRCGHPPPFSTTRAGATAACDSPCRTQDLPASQT